MGSMTDFDIPADAVAFTPAVQAIQTRLGTRRRNAALIWPAVITRDLADFIARQRSIFLGTASADGQPYLQHRGGAPGFLKVIDHSTLGMVDLPGNGQFITLGHLSENDRVLIFLICATLWPSGTRRSVSCGPRSWFWNSSLPCGTSAATICEA